MGEDGVARPARASARGDEGAKGGAPGGVTQRAPRSSILLLGLIGLGSVQALAIAGTLIWLALGADETADRLVREAEQATRLTVADPETGAGPAADTPPGPDRPVVAAAETPPVPAEAPMPSAPPATDPSTGRSAADPLPGPAPEEETPAGPPAEPETAPAPSGPVEPVPPEPSGPVEPTPSGPVRPADPPIQLAAAPFASLTEPGPDGPLPVRGADGLAPWQAYARPYPAADPRPRVALVVAGLAQSAALTRRTIERMPGTVTLAFDPYSPTAAGWLEIARDDGHETLLEAPMEPADTAFTDPGPWALLTGLDPSDNRARLYRVLARGAGYVGLLPRNAERFLTSPAARVPLLEELADRGLVMVSPTDIADESLAQAASVAGAPLAVIDQWVDAVPTAASIDLRLARLEEAALLTGVAVGVINPYPLSLARVERWAAALPERGVALVPLSATIGR